MKNLKGVDDFFAALAAPPQLETEQTTCELSGKWTELEDKELSAKINSYLRENANENNIPWSKIATGMNRSQRQIRERWYNHLMPGIHNNSWEKWEDDIIIREAQKKGHQWAKISVLLPGRTPNQIKNRWYSRLSKDFGVGTIKVPELEFPKTIEIDDIYSSTESD